MLRRLLVLVAIVGCDIPESPLAPTRELSVQAVIDAASLQQLITVEWSDGSRRTPSFSAAVFLILPDGRELRATPDVSPNGSEVYSVNTVVPADRIQPGAQYGLRVVDGSKVVTGTTTVPTAQPVPNTGTMETFSRQRDTLRLSWQRVAGARAYHVAVLSRATGADLYYSTFADTSIVLPGTLRTLDNDLVFREGGLTAVLVSAVDDNFYTYYHAAIDPFAGAPPSRLNGAIGVFGSMVPIVLRRLSVEP